MEHAVDAQSIDRSISLGCVFRGEVVPVVLEVLPQGEFGSARRKDSGEIPDEDCRISASGGEEAITVKEDERANGRDMAFESFQRIAGGDIEAIAPSGNGSPNRSTAGGPAKLGAPAASSHTIANDLMGLGFITPLVQVAIKGANRSVGRGEVAVRI